MMEEAPEIQVARGEAATQGDDPAPAVTQAGAGPSPEALAWMSVGVIPLVLSLISPACGKAGAEGIS